MGAMASSRIWLDITEQDTENSRRKNMSVVFFNIFIFIGSSFPSVGAEGIFHKKNIRMAMVINNSVPFFIQVKSKGKYRRISLTGRPEKN